MPNIGNGKNAVYGSGANRDAKGVKEWEKWDRMTVQEETISLIVIFCGS